MTYRDPEQYRPARQHDGSTIPSLFDAVERAERRAYARREDPKTSHDAAISITCHHVTELQNMILLALLTHGPMCDERIFLRVTELNEQRCIGHISPSGCRSRRAELVDKKLVRDSGDRTTELTHRASIIWEVC